MLNRKNYTYKVCLCDGHWCDGHITVQADTEEAAYDMVMDYILNTLAKALPELGINVYIELEEEENAEDKELEAMWYELEDIPFDENECLDVDWQGWDKGTHREEIWHWFDERHSKGVAWLMYEYRA